LAFVFRKGEIELVQPLGLGTKPMPVVTMELVLKLFHLERQSLHLIGQKPIYRPQFFGVIGGDIEAAQHSKSYTGSGTKQESTKRTKPNHY
jgi:hypothetical protein